MPLGPEPVSGRPLTPEPDDGLAEDPPLSDGEPFPDGEPLPDGEPFPEGLPLPDGEPSADGEPLVDPEAEERGERLSVAEGLGSSDAPWVRTRMTRSFSPGARRVVIGAGVLYPAAV